MEDTDEDVPSSPLPPEFIINDLPEEILERVLSYLSPYSEVHVAARVCKLWRRLIQGVILKRKQAFVNAACEGVLKWSSCECPSTPVTGRSSHSVAYVNGKIFFFGGCSGSRTAFNDMWNLDLSTREWTRVLGSGFTANCNTIQITHGSECNSCECSTREVSLDWCRSVQRAACGEFTVCTI